MTLPTVVCVPYRGDREHMHDDAMDVLKYELQVPVISIAKCAYVSKARSLLATTALREGAEVVFFIDSDSLFDPSDVSKVADEARATKGIVGVPYSQRSMGASVVGGFDESVDEVTFYEGGGLYPASGCIGMGFTAIHREVFERIQQHHALTPVRWSGGECVPYFRELIVGGNWLLEDASFCHEARELGCSTMLDTRYRVLHLGEHPFSIEDCRTPSLHQSTLKLKLKR